MPPKRKHQSSEPQDTVHASRQFQVYGSAPKPPKKARRSEAPVYKKQIHTSSVNAIKKRIRDVTRRLERAEDLPANVRVDDERALDAYNQELAVAEAEKLRQKMIKKYHMVRFFERQKATRHLKKLRKRLLETESSDEVQELKDWMHITEVDLNYTQYYPLTEIYISLYPQKNGEGHDRDSNEGVKLKPPMWAEVEKCMKEGTLNQLRNRSSHIPVNPPKKLKSRPVKPKPQPSAGEAIGRNRRERRIQSGVTELRKTKNNSIGFEKNQAFGSLEGAKKKGAKEIDEAEESDGGFFEE